MAPFERTILEIECFSHMVHRLQRTQFLPISLDNAWKFFSNPANLNKITPDDLVFEITSELPEVVYPGLMITYRIRPMLNIPVEWCTEITHVKEGQYFVDEQRKGPYRMWHHEHHFKEVTGGVEMTDIVHYDIGKWILGDIAGALFVHRRVKEIFDFRQMILGKLFPSQKAQ